MTFAARFCAMGSECSITSDAPVFDAVDDVYAYERRWSRFIPSSELSRLAARRGRAVAVARETVALLRFAGAARSVTGGAFDPSVGMHAIGYGPAAVVDAGGVAKGWAADAVARRLVERGAEYAAVDLGGDIAVIDRAGAGTEIEIEDPERPDATIGVITIATGGVATSGVTRRRWTHEGHEVHHLIDPTTGDPARAGLIQVTVVAGSAAVAEVATKVFMVRGWQTGAAFVAQLGAAALAVTDAGRLQATPSLAPFARWLAA